MKVSKSKLRWMRSKKSRSQFASDRRVAPVKVLSPPDRDGACACAMCGTRHHPTNLEIDHVDKITWDGRAVNSWRRVARYWREHRDGVKLRTLCRSCNARDGARRMWRQIHG